MADEEQEDESDRLILEELEVLESIYIDELTVTQNARGRPSVISLQLHPATGDDKDKKYVCMTLILEIPDEYPDKIPEIVIKNPRGIGEEEIQSLHTDMVHLAKDRSGGHMLYEIIELAKESLTEGNIPHCPCTICYEHFHEGDNFTKTDCYHYFHQTCLSRYIEHTKAMLAEEKEDLLLHQKEAKNDEEKTPCPVCRENITYDPEILTESKHTEESHYDITISDDVRQWQQEMAVLLEQQKRKGGVIDLEAEKNKFLVAPDEVVVIQRSNSPYNLQDEKSEKNRQEKERNMDKRTNDKERFRHYNDNYFRGRGRGRGQRGQSRREEEDRKTSRERNLPRLGKFRDYDRKKVYRDEDKHKVPENYENKKQHLDREGKASSDISNVEEKGGIKREKLKEKVNLEDKEGIENVADNKKKNFKSDVCVDSVNSEKNTSDHGDCDLKSEHQKSKMYTSERTSKGNSSYTNSSQNEKTLSSSDSVKNEKLVSSDHESAGNCPPDYRKGDKHGYESFRTFGRGRGYSRGRYSSKGYRERGDGKPKMDHESFNSTYYKDDKYTSRNTFDSHRSVKQGDVEKDMDFETREFQQKKENYYHVQKREKYQGYRNMHDNRNFRTKSANYNQREKGDVREHKSNSAKYSPRRPGEYTSRERKEEKSDLKDETVVTKGRGNWDLEHKSEVENSIKIEKDKGQFKENSIVKFSKGRGRGRKTANEKKSDNDFRTETTTTNKLLDSKIKGKCENEHKCVSKDIENKIMENRAENCVNDYDSVKNGKNEEQSLPPGFPVKRPPPGFTKICIDDRTSTVKPPPGFENVEKTS